MRALGKCELLENAMDFEKKNYVLLLQKHTELV